MKQKKNRTKNSRVLILGKGKKQGNEDQALETFECVQFYFRIELSVRIENMLRFLERETVCVNTLN